MPLTLPGRPELATALDAAIETLRSRDGDLTGTTERAVVARLMIYLDRELTRLPASPHLRLDMEYERSARSVKSFERPNPPTGARRRRKIVPDLVYHQRGTSVNHLAIEVKAAPCPRWQEEHDLAKLLLLTGRTQRIGMDARGRFHPFDPAGRPASEEIRRPRELGAYTYGVFLQLHRIDDPIAWI
ncbi:hypothetical protein [Actinoplanes sp. NPDC051851]|uniref:hypothetical protein n=1 Tax=Actinoplanes sp. NPDC051851 TaxID=3154753 RepID=UPI00342C0EE0